MTLYDSVNPIFTATGYSFPGFLAGAPPFGFLGVCSTVPLDGFSFTTHCPGNTAYLTAENFVYGGEAASHVPEPGAIVFAGVAVIGTAALIARRQLSSRQSAVGSKQ